MKIFLSIFLLSLPVFVRANESASQSEVRVGDSTVAVRNHMGEPDIEFPLNGQLIQDYGHSVIVSSNGVVVAIRQRQDAKPAPKKSAKHEPTAMTISGLLAKAQAGDAESQYCLAYCYQSGEMVDKSMDKAIRWYTLAAMQGHMASQHNLGVIYMNGDGIPRDYEQAYTWALLAAGNGNDQLADLLRPRLTGAQRQAGKLRARRIIKGLEESPYGTPDSSTANAQE